MPATEQKPPNKVQDTVQKRIMGLFYDRRVTDLILDPRVISLMDRKEQAKGWLRRRFPGVM